MNIPYVMRQCTKCGRWLVASTVNFRKNDTGKYGLRGGCKECEAMRDKQYREANKDRIAKYSKQWHKANRDKMNEYYKQYRQTPKGQALEFNKNQRRRIKEEQQGSGITTDQWLEMMNFFDWKSSMKI